MKRVVGFAYWLTRDSRKVSPLDEYLWMFLIWWLATAHYGFVVKIQVAVLGSVAAVFGSEFAASFVAEARKDLAGRDRNGRGVEDL